MAAMQEMIRQHPVLPLLVTLPRLVEHLSCIGDNRSCPTTQTNLGEAVAPLPVTRSTSGSQFTFFAQERVFPLGRSNELGEDGIGATLTGMLEYGESWLWN